MDEIFTKPVRAAIFAYIVILIIGALVPSAFFPLNLIFFIAMLAFGIFEMIGSGGKEANLIMGGMLVMGIMAFGIFATEMGHAGYATVHPDLSVKGGNVTVLNWGENVGEANVGWIRVEYDDATPGVTDALANTVLAGSVLIAILAALWWAVPTPTNAPALIWTLMLFSHAAPFLKNDTSMAISNGWMSLFWGWVTFLIMMSLVLAPMIYSLVRRRETIV